MSHVTFRGGVHPAHHKEATEHAAVVKADVPAKLYIPLSQHIGAPCKPLVAVGDEVKLGQKIGESEAFVSAPVHASVSGKVVAIETVAGAGMCVVIENDGKDEIWEGIKGAADPAALSADELRAAVKEAGIVGMGGATFPTHVKLNPPKEKKIEYVILNGGECEPYLTSDHRIMVEKPERVVAGLKYLMKIVGAGKGIVGVEDNKMDAVEALKAASANDADIEIMACEAKYPQGAEKQLIVACIGREVPSGGLPMDAGVVVNNVGTAAAVADAVEAGMPLIERNVTVSGSGVAKPANYLVRVGTLYSDVIAQSGGTVGTVRKIISGGPMMGIAQFTDRVPVTKGTSGILALTEADVPDETTRNCVRCAKCVDICPAFLEPSVLGQLAKYGKWEDAKAAHVMDCIECGSCAHVCPAKIPLVQQIRLAKQTLRQMVKK